MARLITIVFFIILVAGCSTIAKLADYGATANDQVVKDSKFIICKGASIGAVMREFNTKEKAEGWVKICLGEKNTPPLLVEALDE